MHSENSENDSLSSQSETKFNFASYAAGAVVLDKSPTSAKGFSNLLDDDKDRYGISPCNEKKWVVIGLSEDILVSSIVIANYEKYSSLLKDFQLLASTSFPTEDWLNLGEYQAEPILGEQTFLVPHTQYTPHTRYLKFKFLTHYGSEDLCTLSQIKVHGTTVIASFQQEVKRSDTLVKDMLNQLRNEESLLVVEEQVVTDTNSQNNTNSTGVNDDINIVSKEASNPPAMTNATIEITSEILESKLVEVSDSPSVSIQSSVNDSLIGSDNVTLDYRDSDSDSGTNSNSNSKNTTSDIINVVTDSDSTIAILAADKVIIGSEVIIELDNKTNNNIVTTAAITLSGPSSEGSITADIANSEIVSGSVLVNVDDSTLSESESSGRQSTITSVTTAIFNREQSSTLDITKSDTTVDDPTGSIATDNELMNEEKSEDILENEVTLASSNIDLTSSTDKSGSVTTTSSGTVNNSDEVVTQSVSRVSKAVSIVPHDQPGLKSLGALLFSAVQKLSKSRERVEAPLKSILPLCVGKRTLTPLLPKSRFLSYPMGFSTPSSSGSSGGSGSGSGTSSSTDNSKSTTASDSGDSDSLDSNTVVVGDETPFATDTLDTSDIPSIDSIVSQSEASVLGHHTTLIIEENATNITNTSHKVIDVIIQSYNLSDLTISNEDSQTDTDTISSPPLNLISIDSNSTDSTHADDTISNYGTSLHEVTNNNSTEVSDSTNNTCHSKNTCCSDGISSSETDSLSPQLDSDTSVVADTSTITSIASPIPSTIPTQSPSSAFDSIPTINSKINSADLGYVPILPARKMPACLDALKFQEFKSKMEAKLSTTYREGRDTTLNENAQHNENVFTQLMQKFKSLEMHHAIYELYAIQMSECHQLILRDLWAQERVTLTTDKMSQIEAMIESAHQQQEYMNQLTLAMQLSTQISASDRSALAALQSSRSGSYTFGRSKPSNIIIPPSSSSSSSFHTIDNNMNRHIEESEKSTDNNQEHDSKQQHKQQTILSSYSDINHPFIYPGFGLRCFDDCKIFSSNPLALRDCYENVYRSICKNDQFPVLFRDTRDRLSNGQIRDLTSNCDQSESTSFSTIHRSVPTTTTSTLDSSGENVKDKLFDSQTRSVYDYMQSQSGTGLLKSLRLDLIPKMNEGDLAVLVVISMLVSLISLSIAVIVLLRPQKKIPGPVKVSARRGAH